MVKENEEFDSRLREIETSFEKKLSLQNDIKRDFTIKCCNSLLKNLDKNNAELSLRISDLQEEVEVKQYTKQTPNLHNQPNSVTPGYESQSHLNLSEVNESTPQIPQTDSFAPLIEESTSASQHRDIDEEYMVIDCWYNLTSTPNISITTSDECYTGTINNDEQISSTPDQTASPYTLPNQLLHETSTPKGNALHNKQTITPQKQTGTPPTANRRPNNDYSNTLFCVDSNRNKETSMNPRHGRKIGTIVINL